MKHLALSLALVLGASACGHADSIGSFATGGPNLGNINSSTNFAGVSTANIVSNGTNNSYFLDPGSVWEAAGPHSTWVGYLPSAGPGGVNPPGTISAPEYYTFTTSFTVGGDWSGFLSVGADDTTDIFLNGTQIEPDGALGTDFHCANGLPNCSVFATVNISGHAGLNNLTFVVEQAGFGPGTGDPSGLDFTGEVTPVPEVTTILLVGSGLFFLIGGNRLKEMQSV